MLQRDITFTQRIYNLHLHLHLFIINIYIYTNCIGTKYTQVSYQSSNVH